MDARCTWASSPTTARAKIYSKPNSGVLNYPTGVVLHGRRGQDRASGGLRRRVGRAHQEARVLLRPRRDLDDAGHARTTTPTSGPTGAWTSRRPQAGTYLLDIRTTSITPDGADRVCQYDTQFMFTVE